jgi:hypothetical protein
VPLMDVDELVVKLVNSSPQQGGNLFEGANPLIANVELPLEVLRVVEDLLHPVRERKALLGDAPRQLFVSAPELLVIG